MNVFDRSASEHTWRQAVPTPVYEADDSLVTLYWKAWELAWKHVKDLPGMPQTPYMDEAFIETDIWIWDTCFMTFFCKYAPDVFPGIESLRNFYEPMYDGKQLPEIEIQDPKYPWGGLKKGDRVRVVIHITDNPPLFAWAEYAYAQMTGDAEHLRDILLNKKYLQKHFDWLEHLTQEVKVPGTRNVTCWQKTDLGYRWEGGRSGMDNTPRGRTGKRAGDEIPRPNHPNMLWIDAIAQQTLSALCIARCAERIGETELQRQWMETYERLKKTINDNYWDDEDRVYYDIHEHTGEFMKCLTTASFWPLLAEVASPQQAEDMCRTLQDPHKLGGKVPVLSLARDDADFAAEVGNYWRGSLWLPTAYMTLKALEKYGKFQLAHDCALKILDHMNKTFQRCEPHTIWECYAPNEPVPAQFRNKQVRKDFCGWSAVGPIALFLENVIGIYGANAFDKTVSWHLPKDVKGKVGIRHLRFGSVDTDLIAENGTCTAVTNEPYTLKVNGKDFQVPAGTSEFYVL